MKKSWLDCLKNGSILLLTLLCCTLFLRIPKLWGRWCDERLLNTPLQRPAVEGMLSPEEKEIPLLNALYKKRYLGGNSTYKSSGEISASEEAQLKEKVSEMIGRLVEAGVIPAELAPGEESFAGEYQLKSDELSGFESIHFEKSRIVVEWHKETGRVIGCQVPTENAEALKDASVLLENYKTYLEIENLDDWKQSDPKNGSVQACWSEKGQAYLHCSGKPNCFEIGIISLPPVEMKKLDG